MKTIECKIGDVFCIEDGTKLEVAKSVLNCKGCYFFNDKDKSCSRPKNIICSAPRREDKEFVIFKQVKDNNMKEKRNIQISLEEAREWYNSDDSFKKELALKIYKKEELKENYISIIKKLSENALEKNRLKRTIYGRLMNTVAYVNSIYPKKYIDTDKGDRKVVYYFLSTKDMFREYSTTDYHKGFYINTTSYMSEAYLATFNSREAAIRAIDILGDELKILFK